MAALISVAAPINAYANDTLKCASTEEAASFRMRHLQSQLMVAALSCNQQVAYNHFVERFRPQLTAASGNFVGYFKRTGGGETALNRHITELANAAGLSRAEEPEDFCAQTWSMFLLLEEDPADLPVVAASHSLPRVSQPDQCDTPKVVETKPAAPKIVPVDVVKATIPVAQ